MKNLFRLFAVIESKFSIKFRFQHCSEQLRNPPSGIFNAQVRAQWSKKKHQSRSLNSTRMCLYAVATCRAAALCEADEWWSSSAGQQATRCFIRHEWDWFQVVIKLSSFTGTSAECHLRSSSSIERKSSHSIFLQNWNFHVVAVSLPCAILFC